jgi:hypothetical protein
MNGTTNAATRKNQTCPSYEWAWATELEKTAERLNDFDQRRGCH